MQYCAVVPHDHIAHPPSMLVGVLRCLSQPITQMALTVLGDVRYHDYEGVTDAEEERARIVEDLVL